MKASDTPAATPATAEVQPRVRVRGDTPSAPVVTDDNGNELDGWGLPRSGPLRAARLAELKKPDPDLNPEAWSK